MQWNQSIIFVKNIYYFIICHQLREFANLTYISDFVFWHQQRLILINNFRIFGISHHYPNNIIIADQQATQVNKMTTEQLSQTKQKYLDTLNRVNLLLLKQHDLRRDQRIYLHQLQKIQDLLFLVQTQSSPESQGGNNGINVLAEDSHLRQIIKENQREIWRLERKKGQGIWAEVNQLKNVQAKYLNMIDNQFQNGIQQKLSTIRGKVDELKKKIKEINKEILGYEQEHLEGIDQYSFCLTILKDYQNQNKELKQQIAKLKSQKK